MAGFLIPAAYAVAKWGSAVYGASLVNKGLKRVAPASVQPVVAGIGDTLLTVLDPLDLTGYRANKEEQEQANQQKKEDNLRESLAHEKDLKKQADAALKHAQQRAKDAEAKAKEMARQAGEAQRKAKNQAQAQAARAKQEKAKAATRLAALARSAQKKGLSEREKSKDSRRAYELAMASIQLSQQANDPQQTIELINDAQTPEGKSIAATIADAVWSDRSFNPAALVDRLANPFGNDEVPSFGDEDEDDMIEGRVAGPGCKTCCSSCVLGGECSGKSADSIPEGFLDGSVNGSDYEEGEDYANSFFDYMYGDDRAPLIAGPDSDFFARAADGAHEEGPSPFDAYGLVCGAVE